MKRNFENLAEAYEFLKKLGASAKLIRHLELVGEAAEILIGKLADLNVEFDPELVRYGAAFHDAGKIVHTDELSDKGSKHEPVGERLLLDNGVDERLARCCRSHGQWETLECSFEEYLIALSDKLWKGKREDRLEQIVIDKMTERLTDDRWEIFVEMDSCFEQIAADGAARLSKSRDY